VTRVLVVGLDALDARLVETWLPELPTLRQLCATGVYGPLESIVQPVTPVAWTCMVTGVDPGRLGFTDFTYRPDGGYGPFRLVHSRVNPVPTIFHRAAAAGLRTAMVGVPVSYPPLGLPGGICVSCFMAPRVESGITAPADLQQELLAQTSSPYLVDVPVVEDDGLDRHQLAASLLTLDAQRFDLARYLLRREPWDLFFVVCMGTDRVGHYFMRFQDRGHARHDADPRFAETILEHYRYCDRRLGELLEEADDETAVMVVSDHGMQRLDGKVQLNDWLRANGYLRLDRDPDGPARLAEAGVDWTRTRAWSHGYGGQIFLNLRGRDPAGCVDPDAADDVRAELAEGLRELRGPGGEPLHVEVFPGPDLYTGPLASRCPDLCVQVDGLRYLAANRVGGDRIVRPVTELGLDDGAHARLGFLALAGHSVPPLGRFEAMHLLDVAPTLLGLLGLDRADLEGAPLHEARTADEPDADEAELTNRLRHLYLD
jgi:predicted AlkP superfamily phosphohydrolase/phosphomutase